MIRARLVVPALLVAAAVVSPVLAQDVTPPTVTDVTADGTALPGVVLTSAPSSIVVTFSEEVDAATVTTDAVRLVRSGGDGTFGDGNEVEIVPTSVTLDGTGTQATMELTGATLPDDDYQITVGGTPYPTAGLVAHWKFDETSGTTAYDSSGNGNDGTLLNRPSWQPTGGQMGGALSFDGADDGMQCPVPSGLTVGDMTAAWWAKVPSTGWGRWDDWWEIATTDDILVAELRGESAAGDEGYLAVAYLAAGGSISQSGPYLPGTGWHHLACTFSAASDQLNVYADGAPANSTLWGFNDAATNVSIGYAEVRADGRNIRSSIDDFRIYNRALWADEIASLASGSGLLPVTDLAANPLDGEYSGSFPSGDGTPGGDFVCTFRIDTTAPAVSGTPPLEGATDVSISTEITVTFAEEMDQASTEAAFSIDPDVPGTFSWSDSTLTFTPSGALDDDTTYTITISTDAKDLAGHALEEAYTFTFTTEDLTAPVAVTELALSPGDENIAVTWRNPSDLGLAGVVILRNTGADPTGVPADGTAYTAGEAIGADLVAYVGEGANPLPGNKSSWADEGLLNGTEYHYAVFAFDEALNYSAGVADSAEAGKPSGGDGGLCTASAYGSPLARLALLSLFALAIARTRRAVRSSRGRVHGTS